MENMQERPSPKNIYEVLKNYYTREVVHALHKHLMATHLAAQEAATATHSEMHTW